MRVFPCGVQYGGSYTWWTVVQYVDGVPQICGNQGFPEGQQISITRAGCAELARRGFEIVRWLDPDGRYREHELKRARA